MAESVAFHASESERWRCIFLGVLGHDLRGPLNAMLQKVVRSTVIDAPIDMESLPSSSVQGTNVAKKDFASLKKTHDVDKLLLIQIQSIGIGYGPLWFKTCHALIT